jgi:HlyD family secretion protein
LRGHTHSAVSDRRARLWIALMLLAVVPASGCGSGHGGGAAAGAAAETPTVRVRPPVQRPLARTIEQPGQIEAFEQTPIHAKIAGFIRKVHVEIGTRVRKNDPLADLDVPELLQELHHKEESVAQARLEIRQAEAARDVARASVATSESRIEEALSARKRAEATALRWKSEAARMEALVKERVIDAQSRDEAQRQSRAATAAHEEAEAAVRSARAAKAELEARAAKAEADLAVAQGRLRLAETEEKRLRALVAYTHILAPYDGVVTERLVHTGHFVQPGNAGGKPLFVVARTDKVRVFIDVPEADSALVRPGSKGRVSVQVLNDREFVGTVAGTSVALDPGQRTLRAEIDLDNPTDSRHPDGVLHPGNYVRATLDVERPDAWVLPSAAVLVRDGETFCYEVQGDRVVRLVLRVGARSGDQVEVLKKRTRPQRPGGQARWSDLTGRERIVIDRAGELTDGQAVHMAVEEAGPG